MMNNIHFDTYFNEVKTRVLILSDIHFRTEYDSNLLTEFKNAGKKEEFNKQLKVDIAKDTVTTKVFQSSIKRLEKYIENFIEKVVELNTTNSFDYLLINGDIAFSGEERQYKLFKQQIVDKILVALPNISIGQIPGNHDISIKNINNYFAELAVDNSFLSRVSLLNSHYDPSFKSYFENFSNYQNDYISSLNLKSNIDVHLIDNLFGYIIDHNKRNIFMLINSAWYCLGPKWANVYMASSNFATEFTKDGKNKTVKSNLEIRQLKELIEKGQEFYEHEKLITGMELLQSKLPKAFTVFKDYPNYFSILQMHHPTNWLHWNEVYDTDSKLSKLMDDADLCVFGHQHLSKLTSTKRSLQSNTFSIDAGMFSADNLFIQHNLWNKNYKISPFEQCRFSVLDITNGKTKKFTETKYFVQQYSKLDEANIDSAIENGSISERPQYLPKSNKVTAWVDGDSYFEWQEYPMHKIVHSIESQIPIFKIHNKISNAVTKINKDKTVQKKLLENYWGAKGVKISNITCSHTINIWDADNNISYVLIDTLAIFVSLLDTFIKEKSFLGIAESNSKSKLIKLIAFDFLTDTDLNYSPSKKLDENHAIYNTIEESNQIQFQIFKAKMIAQIGKKDQEDNTSNIEYWKPIIEALEFVTIPYWNIVSM
jgi:Calcineurin-like phosphoesterase